MKRGCGLRGWKAAKEQTEIIFLPKERDEGWNQNLGAEQSSVSPVPGGASRHQQRIQNYSQRLAHVLPLSLGACSTGDAGNRHSSCTPNLPGAADSKMVFRAAGPGSDPLCPSAFQS